MNVWVLTKTGKIRKIRSNLDFDGASKYALSCKRPAVVSDAYPTIGEQVYMHRIARGISQRGLAGRSGIDTAAISRLENGRYSPTITTLTKVLEALDLRLALIFVK